MNLCSGYAQGKSRTEEKDVNVKISSKHIKGPLRYRFSPLMSSLMRRWTKRED